MKNEIAVILFGPPGAGKTTQAEHLKTTFRLAHIDSGRLIERTVHDPAKQDDPVIARERSIFDSGVLNTPEWVAHLIAMELRTVHETGHGVVFSGSPRTLYEAQVLTPVLEQLYGHDNIAFIKIAVSPETSLIRNTRRLVCKKCGKIYQGFAGAEPAGFCDCGGRLTTRILDTAEAIKTRLDQYHNRTAPLFRFLMERGYAINETDGERGPDEIAKDLKNIVLRTLTINTRDNENQK